MATYFDYQPGFKGTVQKGRTKLADVPKGQVLRYKQNAGYYTIPKPKSAVVRPATDQGSFTTIETPAQIETRVTRMADAAYNRQKSALDAEVEAMRQEAEGRRRGLTDAYAAAAKLNAGMGADVQQGWEQAAGTISGLAGATTGGVRDALAQDLATQEQALSRVGAGGTGFDARSQAGVEQYRGGFLPAEYFSRMGGVGRQFLNEQASSLVSRGLSEGQAAERVANAKTDADKLAAIKDLTSGREDLAMKLREQLLGARGDQLDAVAAANKLMADVHSDEAKLRQQYAIARMNATTKADQLKVDAIYKSSMLAIKSREADALVAQRNAGANLANTKAQNLIDNPTGGPKPPTATAVSNNIVRANKAGNAAIQTVFDNIWAKTPGAQAPPGWNAKLQGAYATSAEGQKAVAWSAEQRRKSFGTIMLRTVKAISPHLKSLGYSGQKVKKVAYDIVSARVEPPTWWLNQNPGFGPKV